MSESSKNTTTCIVGIADKDGVFIAGDSAGTNGRFQQAVRNDVKVFRNGDMILGGTTSYRMIQLLHHKLKIPKQIQGQSDMDFMVCDFIEAVKKCFAEGGFLKKGRDGQDEGGSFLVGFNGKLYGIHEDFQVAHNVDNYDAVGCGEDLALGSLFTTKDLKMPTKERLTKALEAACHHSAGCSGHFTFEELLNPTTTSKTKKKNK